MKTYITLFFALGILLCMYSCECYDTCKKFEWHYTVELTGFSDSEVTPLVVKRYLRDSHFTAVLDSQVVEKLSSGTNAEGSPSLSFTHWYTDSSEYEIVLPVIGVTYQVSDYTFRQNKCKKCGHTSNVNELYAYKVNGNYKQADYLKIEK